MQRADGAVYRKLSGMTWPKALLPEKDEQPRFLFGISTPETAKFAAVAAMTARVFQSIDPEFATACLDAAQRAWRYVRSHPAMQTDWVAGDDQGSGKYLSSEVDQEPALLTDVDDRLWAATELLLTTHDARFYRYVRRHVPQFAFTLFEWKDPSPLALLTYLQYSTARRTDPRGTRHITQQLLRRVNRVLQTVTRSGYHIANDRFVWGSNKMTAEEGITLFYAYKLTGNAAYRNAAIDQIDYLLGRNHFGLSFVSGIGENAVQHVCHLFAHAAGIPIPGLLVGGPNEEAQCGIAPKGLGSLSYIDHADSYATNEYAIDYNASAIALMAMLVGEAGTQSPVSH